MPVFDATLFRPGGTATWIFVAVPPELAPPATQPWGRAPVRASVNGNPWDTSVWHDRRHGVLLPVPARLRKGLAVGDVVRVEIASRFPVG